MSVFHICSFLNEETGKGHVTLLPTTPHPKKKNNNGLDHFFFSVLSQPVSTIFECFPIVFSLPCPWIQSHLNLFFPPQHKKIKSCDVLSAQPFSTIDTLNWWMCTSLFSFWSLWFVSFGVSSFFTFFAFLWEFFFFYFCFLFHCWYIFVFFPRLLCFVILILHANSIGRIRQKGKVGK